MVRSLSIASVLGLAILSLAHPGEHHDPAQVKREAELSHAAHLHVSRALGACSGSDSYNALKERAIARRAEKANALRQKRDIAHKPMYGKRDTAALQTWAAESHNKTDSGPDYSVDTSASVLFSGNATCALAEETTLGPYYVSGELVRKDVTEEQSGVPLYLDIQFVDISNCGAVKDMMLEIWHCNATGVYSGVTATGQGGLRTTWLRGAQLTNSDGVAEFETIFPGHYTGRATHIHVLSTKSATVLANGTYDGGVATHVGQLFFDQSLISLVEAVSPYTTNAQELTSNVDDSIAAGEASAEYDPFMDYALLGDSQEDGVLAWITVGVNTTANYNSNITPAAEHYADYDVDTSSSQNQGGGGGGPGGDSQGGSRPGSSSTATASSTSGSTSSATGSAASSSSTTSGSQRLRSPFRLFGF